MNTAKLFNQIKFSSGMKIILNQQFITVIPYPNYYECTCRLTHLKNHKDIIYSDCRLFIHLFSLVTSGKNFIKFQMPNGNVSREKSIPENACYLYPDTPYRTSLGSAQGQFLYKYKNFYWGLDRDGVQSMTLCQWKRLYLEKIHTASGSGKTLIQNIKISIIYDKLINKEIIFRVKRWGRGKRVSQFQRKFYQKKISKRRRIKRRNNNEHRSLRF